MPVTPADLMARIAAELTQVRDQRIIDQIQRYLVPPHSVERAWDYGEKGQTYPCWSVLEHGPSDTGIVWCEHGFGPKTPWGLVFLTGASARMSMGMDCGWFPTFLSAFDDSWACTDLPI